MFGFFALLYAAYFIWAIAVHVIGKCKEEHDVMPLIYLTIAIVGGILYWFVTSRFGDEIGAAITTPLTTFIKDHWSVLKW